MRLLARQHQPIGQVLSHAAALIRSLGVECVAELAKHAGKGIVIGKLNQLKPVDLAAKAPSWRGWSLTQRARLPQRTSRRCWLRHEQKTETGIFFSARVCKIGSASSRSRWFAFVGPVRK